jgi:hypothetical protein
LSSAVPQLPARALAALRRHLGLRRGTSTEHRRTLVRRHEVYWVPLVYLAAFVFLYRLVFFPGERPVGFGWDTIEGYWSDLAHLAAQWQKGEWPLWNPYDKGGFPDFALPERGHHAPVNWLLGGIGAALGDVPWWLMQAKQYLHHLLAACLMHLFLRSRGLPTAAALVGGMAWLGGAPMLIHKASSILWPLAWTPLLWMAADRLVSRPGWRSGCLLAGAIALAGQAGSAPGFYYALGAALPYGALRVAAALWAVRRDRAALVARARRLALALAVTLVTATALLLVTMVPTAELTALSVRAERTMAYALSFPLPPGPTLIGMVAPASGKYDVYLGVAVVVLLACALARPRRDGGVPLLFAGLSAAFLVLSFGGATPLLPWLVEHVPGFGLFRAANRYKLALAPLCAVLAAYGAANLLDAAGDGWRRRAPLLLAALAAAGLAAIVAAVAPRLRDAGGPGPLGIALVALAVVALAAIAVVAPRRIAAASIAFVAVVTVWDPQRFVHARNPALEARVDHREDLARLADLADVTVAWRVWDEFVLEQRPGPRLQIREMRGYPAGGTLETQRYQAMFQMLPRRPELLPLFNVRYVLHGRHHRIGLGSNALKKPPDQLAPAHFRRIDKKRFEAIHPAPLAAWHGAATVVDGPPRTVLEAALATQDPDGTRRRIVLEPAARDALGAAAIEPLLAAAAAPPDPVVAEVVAYRANRVELSIDAPGDGVVVLNDVMYPGWRVHVDGDARPPLWVNGLVRGVAVTAGHHAIVWEFRPRGHGLRLLAWWAGFLAVLCALLPPRSPPSRAAG